MKAFLSYLAYGFFWTVAWLPTPVHYLFSDFLFLVLYHMVGYRRAVVRENLYHAFPEKSDGERQEIERKFYRHLCDLIVEGVRMIHMSTRELQRRVEFSNHDYRRFEEMNRKKIHCIIASAHYGNWEWANAFSAATSYYVMAVYKPLHDKVIEKLLTRARMRWTDEVVPMSQVYRRIFAYHRQGLPVMSYFIADQSPLPFETEYFTRFLNRETAVFMGIEKIARKFGDPVFFLVMKKKKRGHYKLEFHDCCLYPHNEEPYAITEKHVRMLERFIIEQPEYWLWSHRRWKYGIKDVKKKKVMVSPLLKDNAEDG